MPASARAAARSTSGAAATAATRSSARASARVRASRPSCARSSAPRRSTGPTSGAREATRTGASATRRRPRPSARRPRRRRRRRPACRAGPCSSLASVAAAALAANSVGMRRAVVPAPPRMVRLVQGPYSSHSRLSRRGPNSCLRTSGPLQLRRRGHVHRSSIEISTTTFGCDAASRRATSMPLEAGHAHVEQHEVRREALDRLQPLLAVARLADRLEPGRRVDHVARHAPEHGLVVDGQDADAAGRGGVGADRHIGVTGWRESRPARRRAAMTHARQSARVHASAGASPRGARLSGRDMSAPLPARGDRSA